MSFLVMFYILSRNWELWTDMFAPRPGGGLSHLRHGGGGGQNDPPSNSKTRKAKRPGDTAIDSS